MLFYLWLKLTSTATFLSNQKVFFDVALCEDNELIMGIGKLSGIANYGVNAVERNGGMRN